MQLELYKSNSIEEVVNKTLTDKVEIDGDMVDTMSLSNPVFRIKYSSIDLYDFIYVSSVNRYYKIENVEYLTDTICNVSCVTDLLLTFQNEILNSQYIIEQHTSGDRYVFNNHDIIKNQQQQQTLYFPNTMDEHSYMLITAVGGG